MDEDTKVYSVSELNRLARAMLESGIGTVWVEGELSNVRHSAPGHIYLTIKDENCQLPAVFFRGSQRELRFTPRDGLLVRAYGQISIYERGGVYQMVVRNMEEWGRGTLHAQFEALKEKLEKEGLFDEARKRALPQLPQHVGIVTSATGAAIRDILNVVSRRFPNLHLVLAPARVQGKGAEQEVADAIDSLNEWGGLDVLIVGRGGGSLEDLWCFNEEVVARAIVRSRIPVISAVGHEIDFTISDFVADLRAPTPSAAAELVIGRKEDFERTLRQIAERLGKVVEEHLFRARSRLAAADQSYVFREPSNLVQRCRQRLEGLYVRMKHETGVRVQSGQQQIDDIRLRIFHRTSMRRQGCLQDLVRLKKQLTALSPLAVLTRGYSITMTQKGDIIRSVRNVRKGTALQTKLSDGVLQSEVTKTPERAAASDPGIEGEEE